MTVTKEIFVDLQEKYNKVIKLITDDSRSDPETQPFLSKYLAREILIGMNASLDNILSKQTPGGREHTKIMGMVATVQLYLGIIAVDTEELSTGESHLSKCLEIIGDREEDPTIIMVALNMYNQFGILSSPNEPEKSKYYLEKAEILYINFKKHNLVPLDISDLFEPNSDEHSSEIAWKNLEKLHTFTLYYLAQIYGALKDALKSAIYCHITLQRQLQSKDYESIDWALNAATLSQFFMEKSGFKQARHHLAASSYILDEYKKQLDTIEDRNEEYDAKMENFNHRSADVARCWAKYGILLLSKSKERLLNRTDTETTPEEEPIYDLSKLDLNSESTVSRDDLQNLDFKDLDLNSYENQVTCKFILTIQDARLVFLNIQSWIEKAKTYYTLENLASDHIQIVQDQSQMYANVLFYEDNPENQAKLHKRRIDLLENLINKINSQYYLQYCREIWYELAQTYDNILNIKADKLRESKDRPSPHALNKINFLVEKSISHYDNFVASFKDNSGNLPDRIDGDLEKPFLQAYFHMAPLYSRYISLDKPQQLKNLECSLKCYQKVVDYCAVHAKAGETISAELEISREMVELLPIKIARLKTEIA